MLQERLHWLIDTNLPRLTGRELDTVHLSELGRDLLKEALREGRAVVTANRYLLDSRTIPFNCPPIVVVNAGYLTPEALQRNLLHFEFRFQQDKQNRRLSGQRFLVDLDRSIYRIIPEGGFEELEDWKVPSVKAVLAWGASI